MKIAKKYDDDDFMPENPFLNDVKIKLFDDFVPKILPFSDHFRAHMVSLQILYTFRDS